MQSVSEFRIVLPKRVYAPGERIEGQVVLSTNAPISCKALRIQLEHRSTVHWHTGSGDNRRDYHGTRAYAFERQTVWGPVHCTSLLDNAGENAVWGTPWAPNEGVVDIPLSYVSGSKVGIKVMDYDWGKKDDNLGETIIDVDQLLAAGGRPVVLPLFRKQGLLGRGAYAQQMLRGMPSAVAVSATASPLPLTAVFPHGSQGAWQQGGARRVRIQVHGAMNLRSADTLSKNDVYCQLFEMQPHSVAGTEPLPDMSGAAGKAVMPVARQVVIPFSFVLPYNMPSSIEARVPWTDMSFSRCSIYANIDIAFRVDPSTRAIITVVQPLPASLPRLLEPLAFDRGPVRPVFGLKAFARACPGCCACLCCCCECCSEHGCLADTSDRLGEVHLACRLDKTGLVPGETVGLSLRVHNSSPAKLLLRLEFVRRFRLNSHAFLGPGPSHSGEVPQIVIAEQVVPGRTVASLNRAPMVVPLLSPDYHGGQPTFDPSALAARWSGDFNLGQRWKAALPEPLLWWTSLRVTLELAPGEAAVFRPYVVNLGVVMCAGWPIADPSAVVMGVPQGMTAAPVPWAQPPPGQQLGPGGQSALPEGAPPQPQGDAAPIDAPPPYIAAVEVPKVDPTAFAGRQCALAGLAPVYAMNPQEDIQCVHREDLTFTPQYPFYGPDQGGGGYGAPPPPPPGAVVGGAGGGWEQVPHPMMAQPGSAGWQVEEAAGGAPGGGGAAPALPQYQ